VRRREVFTALTMGVVYENVFARFLFGMDRDQRRFLKALEKQLLDVGPAHAVAGWRATTFTLLARRGSFAKQRADDVDAIVYEVFDTLSRLLPPPPEQEKGLRASLRGVIRLAAELAIQMRTQRVAYAMLKPPSPAVDANGEEVARVMFDAATMADAGGASTLTSTSEHAERAAVVKLILFPLVVRRDEGGDVVIYPAQVVVAKAASKRLVRVVSHMDVGE